MDAPVAETKFVVTVLNHLFTELQVIQNARLRGGEDKKKLQGNFTCKLVLSTQTEFRKAVDTATSFVKTRMLAVISLVPQLNLCAPMTTESLIGANIIILIARTMQTEQYYYYMQKMQVWYLR